ncbi:MAG: hypothetical protein IT285_13700 [Bdellovibrionales bacterium]|nr:hypothetical protein [Bdellovibrionales bacterium]
MKSKLMLSTLMLSGLLVVPAAQATDTAKDAAKPAAEQSEKQGGRRKRVLMCRDCGKPESVCDCPEELKAKERAEGRGHEHGTEEQVAGEGQKK